MQITHGLRRALQINADGIATIHAGRRHSYRTFVARIRRLAVGLSALGVRKGDRVGILGLNSDRYLECFYACWTIGAVAVPVNTRWSPGEQIDALQDSGVSLLLVDDAFIHLCDRLTASCSGIATTLFMGDGAPPSGMRASEDIVENSRPAEDAGCGGDDLAAIYYTGGTTGRSKGVMTSHRNFVFNAVNYTATVPFDQSLHWLHATPMFHLADANGILTTVLHGGMHSFLPSFDVETALGLIQDRRINFCIFIPTMINMFVNHPSLSRFDLSHPIRCQFGGSPMPAALLKKAMQLLPSWTFINGYGMTELSPFLTGFTLTAEMAEPPQMHLLKSCGRAAIGSEVKVVGADGAELPADEIGELLVRGENVTRGYWNRPEETAAALRDGWLHTGDLAQMDAAGRLYIVDRLKDMIITGGENVYPTEVEQVIYQLPEVLERAVVGLPDETWGERVHAVVRCRPGASLTAEALTAHCRQHIGGYKCPRGVTFRDEPMPLTGARKIRKNQLRDELVAAAEAGS